MLGTGWREGQDDEREPEGERGALRFLIGDRRGAR